MAAPSPSAAIQPLLDDLADLNRDLRLIIEQGMFPACCRVVVLLGFGKSPLSVHVSLAVRLNVVVGVRSCLHPKIPTYAPSADPNVAGDGAQDLADLILTPINV